MPSEKMPLDGPRQDAPQRSAQYARIEREALPEKGARAQAMLRRPRDEDPALRSRRFSEIERRGQD
ncbi:MAG: hypothetical protein V2J26_09660 [Pacificimonas sp.]|jgi:hypothetical protein|nr:hypothetical protein [Pacificimonas sp.]